MNRNAAMNEIALILNGQRERIKVEQCIGGRVLLEIIINNNIITIIIVGDKGEGDLMNEQLFACALKGRRSWNGTARAFANYVTCRRMGIRHKGERLLKSNTDTGCGPPAAAAVTGGPWGHRGYCDPI